MSCADGWNNYPKQYKNEEIAECPDCGGDVDAEGYALSGCNYSEMICKTCSDSPCNGSC